MSGKKRRKVKGFFKRALERLADSVPKETPSQTLERIYADLIENSDTNHFEAMAEATAQTQAIHFPDQTPISAETILVGLATAAMEARDQAMRDAGHTVEELSFEAVPYSSIVGQVCGWGEPACTLPEGHDGAHWNARGIVPKDPGDLAVKMTSSKPAQSLRFTSFDVKLDDPNLVELPPIEVRPEVPKGYQSRTIRFTRTLKEIDDEQSDSDDSD